LFSCLQAPLTHYGLSLLPHTVPLTSPRPHSTDMMKSYYSSHDDLPFFESDCAYYRS
jgi:hypothetical protein